MTPLPLPVPPPRQLARLLRSARRAADEVGAFVMRRHRDLPGLRTARKGDGDFVTEVDLAAERRLRRTLLAEYPEHGFLGEESGAVRPDAEFLWVVDPIDGTSNFAQGLPLFAVSVACLCRGRPVAAAVHCAPERLCYSAALGRGAFRARRRIATPRARLDDAAVLGVQWFRGKFDRPFLEPLLTCGARIRVLGSSVTQLCDVAVGRLHANVQSQGRIWDIAAAALVVEEAGARFTDWQGRPIFPVADPSAEVHFPSLAAPEPMHRALRRLLAGGRR